MSTIKHMYHLDGSLPGNGEIFVFGSNLRGRHGAGAAKVALEKFGAIEGVGSGFTTGAYAIATKNENLKTLDMFDIRANIDRFVAFTYTLECAEFFVTRVGCGLAGYENKDIAPLFRGVRQNCSFPLEWREFLE